MALFLNKRAEHIDFSSMKPRLLHQSVSMLIQYEFSRSTAPVSQTSALVSQPHVTWVDILGGFNYTTCSFNMWVFYRPISVYIPLCYF